MSEICLEDGTINYEGKWLTADDLAKQIKEKMDSGDMKFADLASRLEKLNKAIENSHKLNLRIVLSKEDHERLKTLGGGDDRENIQKAIMAYIEKSVVEEAAPGPDNETEDKIIIIKCPKCKIPIEVSSDERPSIIKCPECGTSGRLTPKNKWAKAE